MRRGNSKKFTGTGPLRNITVLFVENTPGGEITGRIREQLTRMEISMG